MFYLGFRLIFCDFDALESKPLFYFSLLLRAAKESYVGEGGGVRKMFCILPSSFFPLDLLVSRIPPRRFELRSLNFVG